MIGLGTLIVNVIPTTITVAVAMTIVIMTMTVAVILMNVVAILATSAILGFINLMFLNLGGDNINAKDRKSVV